MRQRKYKLAAEVGVDQGVFSKLILSTWDGQLVLVDAWRQFPRADYDDTANVSDAEHMERYSKCIASVAPYGDRATVVRGVSPDVAGLFKDALFDLVYIDANHSFNACLADIEAWTPKVKQGGCICGHDYMDGTYPGGVFGVKSAVLKYFNREPDIVSGERINGAAPSWFVFV